MEVTKWLNWWRREFAGRNASERRANLEKDDAQADPTTLSGKADTAGYLGLRSFDNLRCFSACLWSFDNLRCFSAFMRRLVQCYQWSRECR